MAFKFGGHRTETHCFQCCAFRQRLVFRVLHSGWDNCSIVMLGQLLITTVENYFIACCYHNSSAGSLVLQNQRPGAFVISGCKLKQQNWMLRKRHGSSSRAAAYGVRRYVFLRYSGFSMLDRAAAVGLQQLFEILYLCGYLASVVRIGNLDAVGIGLDRYHPRMHIVVIAYRLPQ